MRALAIVSVFTALTGLTVFGGAMHGQLSGRWGPPSKLRLAGGNVADLPPGFAGDDWECTSSKPLTKVEVDELHCTGHWARRYVNRTTGEMVDVSLLVGHPGRVSVHTPGVCLSSRDWKRMGPSQRVTLRDEENRDHSFWGRTFESNDAARRRMRVYYAWRVDGPWSAPAKARYTFFGNPLLHKVQVGYVLPPWTDENRPDGAQDFLRDFVPQAAAYLDVLTAAPRIQVIVQGEITDDSQVKILESEVFDGSGTVDFGSTPVGTPVDKTFTINNVGTMDLTLNGATLVVPSGFNVVTMFDETVARGGSTTLGIRLDATTEGSYRGTLSFANSDGDESPYEYTISGEVTARNAESRGIANGIASFDLDGEPARTPIE